MLAATGEKLVALAPGLGFDVTVDSARFKSIEAGKIGIGEDCSSRGDRDTAGGVDRWLSRACVAQSGVTECAGGCVRGDEPEPEPEQRQRQWQGIGSGLRPDCAGPLYVVTCPVMSWTVS